MEKIIKRTFFRFFGPTLVASLALAVVSMTDLIVAGQLLGSGAFTAISLALPVTIYVQIIAAIFGGGAGIVLSNLLGQDEREHCNRVFTTALLSAAGVGVATAVPGLLFLDQLILLLGGQPGESMDNARQYIGILLQGMPFLILAPVQLTFLRNDSHPRYTMFCVLAGGVWNLIANISLVLLFDLGIAGIAIGTITSQMLSCVLSGMKLYRRRSSFHLVRKGWSFSDVREMARPGLPAAMIFFFQVVLTVVINHTLTVTGGDNAVAVYAVVKYLITFLYAFYDGVTGSMQPMLGVYQGEGEMDNLRCTASVSFRIMLLLSVVITAVLELGAPLICRIFGVEADMLDITMTAIRIQSLFCVTAGILAFLGAFYRCTGHAAIAMIIAVCNNLVFPVSIILLLANFTPLGSNSVYWGLVLTDYATLLVLFCALRVLRKPGESPLLLISKQDAGDGNPMYRVLIQDKYEDIPKITEEMDRFCEEHGVPMKKRYYIHLCLEELVVNVIQMGFRKGRDNYIDVRVSVLPDQQVVLRIRDDAVEFDPTQDQEVSLSDLLDGSHREEHNDLGLLLVKKVARSYSYKRTVGFNDFMVVL